MSLSGAPRPALPRADSERPSARSGSPDAPTATPERDPGDENLAPGVDYVLRSVTLSICSGGDILDPPRGPGQPAGAPGASGGGGTTCHRLARAPGVPASTDCPIRRCRSPSASSLSA